MPRILCLHGGGANATIFALQCRRLIAALPEFRLVFAEAPHASQAGPDVMSVYKDYGPFKRWLRWLPQHPELTPAAAVRAIDLSVMEAMRDDPGNGEWVAVLGFSQGAKVAASLLYRQQSSHGSFDGVRQMLQTDFKFGVLCAGRAPLVAMEEDEERLGILPNAAQITDPSELKEQDWGRLARSRKVSIPTVHVHGLLDAGLELHRQLFADFCERGSATVVEWQGDHRMPLKNADIGLITKEIRRLAVERGCY